MHDASNHLSSPIPRSGSSRLICRLPVQVRDHPSPNPESRDFRGLRDRLRSGGGSRSSPRGLRPTTSPSFRGFRSLPSGPPRRSVRRHRERGEVEARVALLRDRDRRVPEEPAHLFEPILRQDERRRPGAPEEMHAARVPYGRVPGHAGPDPRPPPDSEDDEGGRSRVRPSPIVSASVRPGLARRPNTPRSPRSVATVTGTRSSWTPRGLGRQAQRGGRSVSTEVVGADPIAP